MVSQHLGVKIKIHNGTIPATVYKVSDVTDSLYIEYNGYLDEKKKIHVAGRRLITVDQFNNPGRILASVEKY